MTQPPYASPPDGGSILVGQAASASFNSPAISVGHWKWLSFVFTWTGFNQVDATVTIQVSNDGTNWDTKSDASDDPVTYTFAAASGTHGISFNGVVTEAYYRVAFVHGTNSAGTISCVIAGKE